MNVDAVADEITPSTCMSVKIRDVLVPKFTLSTIPLGSDNL